MNAPVIGSSRSEPSSAFSSTALAERAVLARLEALDHVGRERTRCSSVVAGAVEHDRRGAELVAAVDDRDLAGELGQEGGVLHRGVAAADHDRLLVAEEGGVAGGAVGDAARGQLVLAGHAELLRLGAHRQDHRAGADLLVADVDAVDARRASLGELDPGGVVGDEARAEALGLVAEAAASSPGPSTPSGIARVVLHVGRLLEQAAPREALDHERLEVGARRVQRGRVAGGPAAHDHDVLDVLDLRSSLSILTHSLYFLKYSLAASSCAPAPSARRSCAAGRRPRSPAGSAARRRSRGR